MSRLFKFMMIGHMEEKNTDEIPTPFIMFFDFDIGA